MELSKVQRKRIKAVLNGSGSVSKLTDPEERHQLALHWNWDDGEQPLQWIVDQPDTDKGTALYIYWLANAPSIHEMINKKVLSKHDDQLVKLITTIEENFAKDFYKNESIRFDPAEYATKDINSVPTIMLKPTAGTTRELVTLETEYINKIYPLTEEYTKKKEKFIAEGIAYLHDLDQEITRESEPVAIVKALQKVVNAFSAQERTKFTPQELSLLKKLNFVWREQICRRYGYKWYLHELHEQVLDYIEFIVVSPDKKYFWQDFGYFMKDQTKIGRGESSALIESFDQLETLDEEVEKYLAEYKHSNPDHTEDQILLFARPYPNGIFPIKNIRDTTWD